MKPRELCEKAWQEIASKFPDFKVVSKGQKLKKTSKNKDLIFEIYFQANRNNYADSVEFVPHIAIYSKSMKNYLDSKNKEEFLVSLIKDSLNSFYQKQLEIGIQSEVRMSDFIAGKALFSFVSSDEEVKEWMSKTNSKILKDSFKRLSTDSERDRFKRILDSYLID